ncbi:tripartite tricarboxylate transporter TctB family protein [Radiobacillus sp. PE A8.2]|uniref:tripartite tricarboxylate transporter TctB family protein n=1 Tax=Radiobacillus sp. PE A8.2 TaxID=3380349 RepID=UPI0038900708
MEIKVPTNLVGGILIMLLSLIIWFLIPVQIPIMATFEGKLIDSRFVPRLLVATMFLISAILIISSLVFKKEKTIVYNVRSELKGILYLSILVIYILLVKYIGFLIACLLLAIVTLIYFKVKAIKYYAITLSVFVAIYLIFYFILEVPLPGIMGV